MRLSVIIVFMLQVIIVCRVEANDLFAGLPFPTDVSFGISSTDLQKSRPSVKFREGSGGLGMFAAVENRPNEHGVVSGYIYHFREGKLGAITYNRTSTNMLSDVETKRIYEKLFTSGAATTTMQTARAGNAFTVKRWSDVKARVEACLEATTRGTTITFISTDLFAVGDFFPDVAEKDKQLAILAKQRSSSSRSENAGAHGIDRLSSDAPPHAALVGE